jgi:hypothetical protein
MKVGGCPGAAGPYLILQPGGFGGQGCRGQDAPAIKSPTVPSPEQVSRKVLALVTGFDRLLSQQTQQVVHVSFTDAQYLILTKGLVFEDRAEVLLFGNGLLDPPIALPILGEDERPKAVRIIVGEGCPIR